MINPLIEKEIHVQLEKLTLQQQIQVLNFAKSLAGTMPVGVPGKDLLQFAGTLSPEEAKEMLEAIEEGCGKVDLNEW
ncbi:hypothetical protein [Floridanema aerugineum]|jgi:hypothetical protein|uniref:Uncharacterized protein n=1 Tax=Floridaenema aerugineum BLCC-F46 TaxID=3153654 RepID=A0ABV4XCF2_9CYAN